MRMHKVMQRRSCRLNCWLNMFVAALSIIFVCQAHASDYSDFDINKVMFAARNPYPDLILLSAHRGIWTTEPENSISAIDKAVQSGFESVEIDVRLSYDQTPYLVHDYELNRLTSFAGFVSATRDSTLRNVRYRNRFGEVTAYKLNTLEEALEYLARYLSVVGSTMRGFVLVVDIKSPPGADVNKVRASGYQGLLASWQKVLQVSQRYPEMESLFGKGALGRAVIFKIKAKELPGFTQMYSDLGLTPVTAKSFNIEPVLHPDDYANGFRVLDEYQYVTQTVGFEAVAEYVDQPIAAGWIAMLKSQNRTVPGFPSWNDYPEGVAMSNGVCCVNRNTDPTVLSQNLDYGGNWQFHLQLGATWLTADTAPFLRTYLENRGKRNLSRIK